MNANTGNKLERIFMGNVPKSISILENWDTIQALERQGVKYIVGEKLPDLFHVNYVTLIQDTFELNKGKEFPKFDNLEEWEEHKRNAGVLVRSEYLEFIQDISKDQMEKLKLTFFYRNFLNTFYRIHKIEVIDDQESFVRELYGMEDFYVKSLNEQLNTEQPLKQMEATIPLRFQGIMKSNQQARLIDFVRENNLVNNSELFVDFLVGKNDGSGIVITPNNELHACYLLFELYQATLIKLTKGKGYHEYIEMSLCPFSQNIEKGQMKYYIRKIQRSNALKSSIGKDFRKFAQMLYRVPLLLFFVLLPLFSHAG